MPLAHDLHQVEPLGLSYHHPAFQLIKCGPQLRSQCWNYTSTGFLPHCGRPGRRQEALGVSTLLLNWRVLAQQGNKFSTWFWASEAGAQSS